MKLVIGGTRQIEVYKSTLLAVKNSKLYNEFKNAKTGPGAIFVNRDGRIFEHMINFLRNDFKYAVFDSQQQEGQFKLELDFWGIPLKKP